MGVRFSSLIRAFEAMGCTVEVPSKGSHWKVRNGSIMYPIPAHNGTKTEIDKKWIRGACRELQIDENELRSHL